LRANADHEENGAYYDIPSGRVINTEHDNRPFLVHFNGGKQALQPASAAVLAKELRDLVNMRRINSILKIYRAKHDWFTSECTSLDDVKLFHKTVESAVGDYSETKHNVVTSSWEMKGGSPVPPARADNMLDDTMTQAAGNFTLECPPGYPEMRSRAEGCALQYFKKALSDVQNIAHQQGITTVSLAQMRKVVQKSPHQLGLYVLTKHGDTGVAKWTHVSGHGMNFWATKPFHQFMTRGSCRDASSSRPKSVLRHQQFR